MKATFRTSGTQLRVKQGDLLTVDRVKDEPGATIVFGDVMLIEDGDKIEVGKPYVANAAVKAEVVEHLRGPKVRVFKMRRRKNSARSRGHRSELSRIRITSIEK